jgi:3-phenylpropionate/cinnamic acid dioxygenase small subunit
MESISAKLAAKEEIRELLYRCSELVDEGDYAGSAALFAHATLTAAGTELRLRGSSEVETAQRRLMRDYDGSPRTKHLTTNVVVDVRLDESRASSRSSFVVLQAVPGSFELAPIMAGRYHDDFERVDGTWRFASRHTIPELVGDVRQHLRIHVAGSASSSGAARA